MHRIPASSMARFLVGVLALLLTGTIGCAREQITPPSPKLSIEGRVAPLEDGGVRMGFPGITTRVTFSGTEIHLHGIASSKHVWFDVSIDGGAFEAVRFPVGAATVPLAENLAPDETHHLELVRRTESWQGTFDLIDLATDGTFGEAPELPKRRLLFIGDSITCGGGSDVDHPEGVDPKYESNGRLAFGTVLARRLDAQVHLVSYGGKGLVRDWQGMRSEVSAPQFYERSAPDEPARRWDHDAWVPDAIAVCLGTNDFNPGIPDEQDWVAAYVAFVQKLRRDAPDAPIYLLESPMHGDDPPTLERLALRRFIKRTVAELADPDVRAVPVAHYPGRPDNAHPTATEHRAIASELEPLYRSALGW